MKNLDINYFRNKLPFEIHKGLSSHCLYNLIHQSHEIILDFDVFLESKGKNLQRPFCWTIYQKRELILSVLKDIKLPSISVIIYKDDNNPKSFERTWKIIDGKQRMSTLLDFYQNKFALFIEGNHYHYKDLDESVQRVIKFFGFTYDIVYEYNDKLISDDDKIKWFELINFSGTPQDKQHLINLKS